MLFRCTVRGRNFPGACIGRKSPVGFYTTRWVEADTPEQAELAALELMRGEEVFKRAVKEAQELGSKVFFEKIVVERGKRSEPGSGATWFDE